MDIAHRPDWQRLRQSLPRLCRRPRMQLTDGEGRQSPGADVVMYKRLRKFQRGILKWHARDSAASERALLAAEQCLREAVEPSCAIHLRKALYDMIGELAPPRARASTHDDPVPMDAAAEETLRSGAARQKRVRKFFIAALARWRFEFNLEDDQIEPILEHVRLLVRSFESRHGSLQFACGCEFWQRLRVAVIGKTQGDGGARPVERLTKSMISAGIWTPSDRAQALGTIQHRPADAKRLACVRCGAVLQSAWFFLHPTMRTEFVLVPRGHRTCGGNFAAIDGTPCKNGRISNIDYCVHDTLRVDCREGCSTRAFCQHGRRTTHCAQCSHLVKRRKLL